MEKRKNKTNKILLFLGILSLLGLSYAIWLVSLKQTNPNLVKSSCLKLSLTNEKNDIFIEKAYPLLNEEGVQRLSSFDTVESTLKNISIAKELYKGGIGAGDAKISSGIGTASNPFLLSVTKKNEFDLVFCYIMILVF